MLISPSRIHFAKQSIKGVGASPVNLPMNKSCINMSTLNMKDQIHPKYYPKAKIRCACSNVIIVGSTKPEMEVEICSNCHPFYTGKEKLIDTAGRIEKFKAKKVKAEEARASGKSIKKKRPQKSGKKKK
jgi:large subunit ribosomal protein L31